MKFSLLDRYRHIDTIDELDKIELEFLEKLVIRGKGPYLRGFPFNDKETDLLETGELLDLLGQYANLPATPQLGGGGILQRRSVLSLYYHFLFSDSSCTVPGSTAIRNGRVAFAISGRSSTSLRLCPLLLLLLRRPLPLMLVETVLATLLLLHLHWLATRTRRWLLLMHNCRV